MTWVVIVWPPNWKLVDRGRHRPQLRDLSCVPKNSAWLGQTVAHIGFLPTLVRS